MVAYFAEIDESKIVLRVISISNEDCPDPAPDNEAIGQAFISQQLGLSGRFIQTSYNGSFRGRYAGVGYTYDDEADVFIEPKPYESWTLSSNHEWEPPTPRPDNGDFLVWDEGSLSWVTPTP